MKLKESINVRKTIEVINGNESLFCVFLRENKISNMRYTKPNKEMHWEVETNRLQVQLIQTLPYITMVVDTPEPIVFKLTDGGFKFGRYSSKSIGNIHSRTRKLESI